MEDLKLLKSKCILFLILSMISIARDTNDVSVRRSVVCNIVKALRDDENHGNREFVSVQADLAKSPAGFSNDGAGIPFK